MQLWEYCSLRQTEQGIVYTLYRARRYTITLISRREDRKDADAILASYSTRLGLLGWKTIGITFPDSSNEDLHFKRSLRVEHRELNVLDHPMKDNNAVSRPCKNAFRTPAFPRKGKLLLNPGSNDVKVRF